MLIKINNKPIKIEEESEEERSFSIVYFTVSCVGYLLTLWIMDYICYIFFFTHPLPFIVWVGKVIAWLF